MSSKLFEPLRIGRITLDHRVVMAPLTRLRADENHIPQAMSATYYEQRASVPGTLLITEATLISPAGGGGAHVPGIYTDDQVRGWKRITEAVHAKGSYIFCQLVALGRAADPALLKSEGGFEVSAPSSVPEKADGWIPKPLTELQIRNIIDDFGQAAKNAIAAGFDGVEVHGANGYLVDQFFHENSNIRTDQWGGSVVNRSRFGVEVTKALVEAIGADRVAFRLSPWNTWQGMDATDPRAQFSHFIQQLKGFGLAYLHLIESRVFNNVDCEAGESVLPFVESWGQESPILVAGGYKPENLHHSLDHDYKNYNVAIVFGRHFLANPDLPFRLRWKIPLENYDRSTFYARMESRGYVDYPFSVEFEKDTKGMGITPVVIS